MVVLHRQPALHRRPPLRIRAGLFPAGPAARSVGQPVGLAGGRSVPGAPGSHRYRWPVAFAISSGSTAPVRASPARASTRDASGTATGRLAGTQAPARRRLTAVAEGVRFTLRLTPNKPPVINGENGVSQKAEGSGKASYYVSFPLLAVEGSLNGAAVSGTAWMDHEWFTHQLEDFQQGWDWFSIQLGGGGAAPTELMLFELRRTDGSLDPYSSGTYIDADGPRHALEAGRLSPGAPGILDQSAAPARAIRWSGASRFPRWAWRWCAAPQCPTRNWCPRTGAGPTYWEGAVTYSGSAARRGIPGNDRLRQTHALVRALRDNNLHETL